VAFALRTLDATFPARILAIMKLMRNPVFSLLPVGLLILQVACGGDSSGPGHVPTTIAATSSTTLTAPPGTDVTELPAVIVRDESGAPLVGAHVTFTVTSGGGTITGGAATTNPSGIATVGSWTLGTGGGANTLSAVIGSLPAVTFTANGFDPCAVTTAHTLGSTSSGALAADDCRLTDGSFVDFYGVTLATAGTYLFNQSSAAFDTYLAVLTSSGAIVGVNDDFGTGAATDSRVKAILPAGSYLLGANSFDPGKVGSYSLVSASSTDQVTNCEDVFVQRGITTPQSLQLTDCNTTPAAPATGFASDEYVIFLSAGQAITVGMTSPTLDSYIELRPDGATTPAVSNDNIDASTKDARFTFTVTASGFYIILAATKVAGALGDYTLTVQ
jgi:hypothetical protein